MWQNAFQILFTAKTWIDTFFRIVYESLNILKILKRYKKSIGIASNNMRVLIDDNIIVGTGCFDNNHITGLYVLPQYQKRGYGSHIMDCLEAEISKKYDVTILDASLPAVSLYEHRGYKTVGHGFYELKNNVRLVYEIMEKNLE